MVKRNIIKIDESLCNGCGSCVIACSEGAIEIQAPEEYDGHPTSLRFLKSSGDTI